MQAVVAAPCLLVGMLVLLPVRATATLDCAKLLEDDRHRPAKTSLGYQRRGDRCEGTIEEDHSGSGNLVVRLYAAGPFVPPPATAGAELHARGLPYGAVAQVTVISVAKKYRLDAAVHSGKGVAWPIAEVYNRLGVDPATLHAVGRRSTAPGIVFVPVGVRAPGVTAASGTVQLVVAVPKRTQKITAIAGKPQALANGGRKCVVDPKAGEMGTWRNLGQGDTLNLPDLPAADGDYCIRFEIQFVQQDAAAPVLDRQELYFAK